MSKSSLRKLAFVVAVVAWPGISQAEPRSIDHNFSHARLQIGDGLPVPITVAPTFPMTSTNPFSPPFAEGPVRAPFAKAITQNTVAGQTANTALPSGRSIVLPSGLLTIPGVTIPTTPYVSPPTTGRRVKGVFLQNSAVFEVETRLGVQFPVHTIKTAQTTNPGTTPAAHTFAVGGRTGSPTMYVCMDTGSPNGYNPTCLGPGGTPPGNPSTINGLLTYTKTKNQFGGPAQGTLTGRATVWAQAAGTPPCTAAVLGGTALEVCQAVVVYAHPAAGADALGSPITTTSFGTIAAGGPFGFANTTPGDPNPSPQLWNVKVTASGLITDRVAAVGGAATNAATSFGGPWTTGRVTVQVTEAVGENETFMLTGSDQRGEGANAAGSGAIMLVAGAVSDRVLSGPNANRAWLALTVPEPGATLGAAGALLALLVTHGIARRRSR